MSRPYWLRRAGILLALLLMVSHPPGVAVAVEKTKCQLKQLGALTITLDGNSPLVDATINGQRVYLMVDTGAATGMITRPAAERLKLRHGWEPGVFMEGVGGHVTVDTTYIKDLTLGAWSTHDVEFPVFTNHELTGNPDVVGVLGENFLSMFDLDIDIAHNRLTFFNTEDCEHTALASYWGVPYDYVAIGRSTEDNPKIWLSVTVNGQPLRAILDTGADVSVITRKAAERAGMTAQTPGVTQDGQAMGIGNNAVDDYVGLFDSFKLGDEEIKRVRLRFGDLFGFSGRDVPEMLLGLDFLRAHHVFLSHSQRRLYFAYVGGPVFQVTGPRLRRDDPDDAPAPQTETAK